MAKAKTKTKTSAKSRAKAPVGELNRPAVSKRRTEKPKFGPALPIFDAKGDKLPRNGRIDTNTGLVHYFGFAGTVKAPAHTEFGDDGVERIVLGKAQAVAAESTENLAGEGDLDAYPEEN